MEKKKNNKFKVEFELEDLFSYDGKEIALSIRDILGNLKFDILAGVKITSLKVEKIKEESAK